MNKRLMKYTLLLILCIVLILSGCLQSSTYQGRQLIINLSLSIDSNRLLSVSGGMPLKSENTQESNQIYDYILWNASTGKIIWNETASDFIDIRISPNGEYLINSNSNSILSVESGSTIINFSGIYYDWSANGNFFVTINNSLINIWDATNFTIIKTIPINESVRKIALSPDGSKLAVEIYNQTQHSLVLINISSENYTALYNYSEYSVFNIKYLSWSKNGTKLQMVKREFTPYNPSDLSEHYKLIIWNILNNNILHNLSFKYEIGTMAFNRLVEVVFEKYIIYDYEKSQLIFYNLTEVETVLQTENHLSGFDLSYDGVLISLGSNGIIKIINVMTGKTINTFQTPQYEIVRPIPGFELVTIFCAIMLILILKYRKKK